MSKLMVKDGDIWVPMEGLKGDTGPLPADESIPDTALVTDGAKTNTAYLMRNRLTKDAEGELISVEDAYSSAALSLNFDGGLSTQMSTTGKNLLSDVPTEWVKRTFADLSGTIVSFAIPITEETTYYYVKTTGSGMSPGMYGGFCDALDGTITIYDRVTLSNYSSYTFTNSGNHAYLIFFAASRNTTASQITNQFLSRKIFVSTNSSDTYEVYSGGAASPRPDWPQEIINVDALTVINEGRNLANPTDSELSATSNGITYNWNGENLTVSGTSTSTNSTSMAIPINNAPILFAGNTYTFSLQGTFNTGGSGTTFYFRTSKRGETNTTLRYILGGTNQWSWKYTPTEDMVLRSIVLRIGKSGSTVNISARIQLELGSTATEYEPYSGVSATLDLSNEPLRSLPDGTKDELRLTYIRPSTREGWAYYRGEKIKRVGYVDMGTLNWTFAYKGQNYEKFWTKVNDMSMTSTYGIRIMSEKYRGYADGGAYALMPDYSIAMRSNTGYISVKDPRFETAADFKAAVNGVMAYYPLATSETIDLGIFELPTMQSGTTHLWSDPSTNLSVTYERDRNIVITNLKAAVADLATS